MKTKILAAKISIIFLVLSSNVYSAGYPVIDVSNITQTMITAKENVTQTAKQLEQYRSQLKQYEDQIRNSVAPAAYLWDQANQTINKIVVTIDTLKYYKKEAGNIEAYLQRYKSANAYRGAECFQASGCTKNQRMAMNQSSFDASEAQKRANDAMIRGLEQQQDMLQQDANKLVKLQSNAQSAEGRMEALQYANQLASSQTDQLLKLRALLITQQAAEAARASAVADREAKESAATESIRRGSFVPSTVRNW